jgi:hypothetical protein
MKILITRTILALALSCTFNNNAAASIVASDTPVEQTVSDRYQQLYDVETSLENSSDAKKSIGIGEAYEKIIRPVQAGRVLQVLTKEDVDYLFRSAYVAAFYTFDKKYVDDMSLDFSELEKRGAASERHFKDLYETMVRTRLFVRARDFGQQHTFPHDALPISEPSRFVGEGPSVLTLNIRGDQWQRNAIILPDGPQIIVIGHPQCHFSQQATAYIENDKELFNIFKKHSKWIMPQDGNLKPRLVAQWNASHVGLPMSYIYLQKEFTKIDAWSTPNFYFFVNGELVGHISGWPPKGGPEALTAQLKKMGIVFH